MKRILFLSIMILSLKSETFAQNIKKFTLDFAPTIGLNRSKLIDSDGEFFSPKNAFSVGVNAFSSTSSSLFYQTGVFINGKGFYEDIEDGDYFKTSLNYLEVPFNIGLRVPINQKFNGTIFGGAYAAYAITGKYEENFLGRFKSLNIFNSTIFGESSRIDGGINFGVSLEINKTLVLSIQRSNGLFKPFKDGEYSNNNRVFNISLSYVLKQI